MKEKLRLKINLLLNDLKISEANEKKNSRYTFNHQLFAEKVKELKRLVDQL